MQLIRCRNKNKPNRSGAHAGKKGLLDLKFRRKKKPKKDTSHIDVVLQEAQASSHFVCIGDYICLYCEDSQGYAFSCQTSSVHNSIYIYNNQSREKPLGVPDPRAVVFQLCIQNRFKLGKKYRQIVELTASLDTSEEDLDAIIEHAKKAAEAENDDNVSEQKMNNGRRLRYGEIIQLKHCFSEKYIHVSSTQTSKIDVNNRMVTLDHHNAKHAQFRILPRYKVRSIGESVQVYDQIILESVKEPGNYLHASGPDHVDSLTTYSELNLGSEMTRFSLVLNFKPHTCQPGWLRGGSVVRLFHKDLEAYLVAEGLFDEQVTEEVHLRVREKDLRIPRTLRPSTSSITYWQVEAEDSIIDGGLLHWEQQVRFRHMCTRQYLLVGDDMQVGLTPDVLDPKTVFRLHPLVKDCEEIHQDSYVRIQHVLTSSWLHELRGEDYERQHSDIPESTLTWDGASLRRIRASRDRKYQDAFTLQPVHDDDLSRFSKVAGMVPFVLGVLEKKRNGVSLNAKQSSDNEQDNDPLETIKKALTELKEMMLENGVPNKNMQKLLRNLRIIDILMKILKLPLIGERDEGYIVDIFKKIYDVLKTYLHGHSNKNCLYFAKYITFCQTQITLRPGDIGQTVAQMVVELIRDNQEIINSITRGQIDYFISLLQTHRHPHFLDLLGVLCVCKETALVENQVYITQTWLEGNQDGMFLTERGQIISKEANVMYISTDKGQLWVLLHEFVNEEYMAYDEELVSFLEHQLDLFGKLCYGRNQYSINKITRELGILAWEEAFICLQQESLLDTTRAMYCRLISELFINVGHNYPTMDHQHCCVVFDEIDVRNPAKSLELMRGQIATELDAIFPALDEWIRTFLFNNSVMVASQSGRNMLLKQVLHMLHYLVMFGFYNEEEMMESIQRLLLNMLDGRNDRPFPIEKDKKKGQTKALNKLAQMFADQGRFEQTPENRLIMDAKLQALDIIEILLALQDRIRLRSFLALFKQTKQSDTSLKQTHTMQLVLSENFDPFATDRQSKKAQKQLKKLLNAVFDRNVLMESTRITSILMDLSRYKNNKLVMKALTVLNTYYSAKRDLFNNASQGLVLTRVDSVRVHRESVHHMPRLRRMITMKLESKDANSMGHALDIFLQFVDSLPIHGGGIEMQQKILINHGLVKFSLDVLRKLKQLLPEACEQQAVSVMKKAARILKLLANENTRAHQEIFDNVEMMLDTTDVESEIAETLVQVFSLSSSLCIKIHPKHIEKIVGLVAIHAENVPVLVNLLCVLVKPSSNAIPLKRNQIHVMKHVMNKLSNVARPFELGRESREQVLLSSDIKCVQHIERLTELLAICAEGENRFIESICNTVMPLEENMWVISHPDVSLGVKRPFIKFLHNVYMKPVVRMYDPEVQEICHNRGIWIFMENLADNISKLNKYITERVVFGYDLWTFTSHNPGYNIQCTDRAAEFCKGLVHFMFDGALQMLKTLFTRFPILDDHKDSPEFNTVCYLANTLLEFSYSMKIYIDNADYLKLLTTSVLVLLRAASMHQSVINKFLSEIDMHVTGAVAVIQENEQKPLISDEITTNRDFETFTKKYLALYEGSNTVSEQLNCKNKWSSDKEYAQPGSEEALPLGEEFQQHVKCFMIPSDKNIQRQYMYAGKIIQYLGISASLRHKSRRQDILDIKCLQILRAMIHNEIVKLPDDWDKEPRTNKAQTQRIKDCQRLMVDEGIVANLVPLLGNRNDDIFRETLALLCSLLFNANTYMQDAIMTYFKTSREEVFFAATRTRVESAMMALKDRRSQVSKERTSNEEYFKSDKVKSLREHVEKVISHIDNYATAMKKPELFKRHQNDEEDTKSKKGRRKNVDDEKKQLLDSESKTPEEENERNSIQDVNFSTNNNNEKMFSMIESAVDADITEPLGANDDGQLAIILKLLAMLCDGQHRDLQNYLRDQPGNLKIFNLVAATVALLNTVYSNIDTNTISLVIQVFDTLNEYTSGCQTNRTVLVSNKLIDHMNFILRMPSFNTCTQEQIHDLYQVTGNLLYTIIEENGTEEFAVAKEVKDTIDKQALLKMMTKMYQLRDPSVPTDDDAALELGFTYYIIYIRLCDIDRDVLKAHPPSGEQLAAFTYYKMNCMSVEIVKDDNLQKVNFRVLNKKIIREEIKEKVKWSIDRTSPSNRIRDFVAWARDILEDARNQKRIMANRVALFFTEKWLWWNYLVIALSVVINILMLITWDAPLALDDVPSDVTALPVELYDPNPIIRYEQYLKPVILALSVLHNCTSVLVLISYFIANHPKLPAIRKCLNEIASKVRPTKLPTRAAHKSRLDVHMFSFTTLYYFLFLALSLGGTTFIGYLFAFHLLHIVTMNHLLQGVIKALTKNGKSLLWVAILGLIVFYLYSLVAFAFMQEMFDPENELYCATLWQCTVSIIRYGLIGDYEKKFTVPGTPFPEFGWMTIYQVSFFIFITTIGLNVIFGIIVDTFSEHRERKWAAESDMKGFCFICGRPNYDFEHHSQGFAHHVKNEHNMWAYIYFLIHLEDTKSNDYTALDLYVSTLMKQDKYEFFPVNMALCLADVAGDQAETKLDDLMKHVQTLVKMQRQKELEKKLREERLHQQRWQEKHRHRPVLQHWSFSRRGRRDREEQEEEEEVDGEEPQYYL